MVGLFIFPYPLWYEPFKVQLEDYYKTSLRFYAYLQDSSTNVLLFEAFVV